MTLADLILLAAALSFIVAVVRAALSAARGRRHRARRILLRVAVVAGLYLLVGLAVSLARPQRVLSVGEPWCFDDWCLTVSGVGSRAVGQNRTVAVDLVISSRARRISQHANGAWIYVRDAHGRRYAPELDGSEVPLEVELGPGDHIRTSRTFRVPASEQVVGLVTGHGGPYCGPMTFLVIGSAGCAFGKPAMVRIES
jgi:hypothetical protein